MAQSQFRILMPDIRDRRMSVQLIMRIAFRHEKVRRAERTMRSGLGTLV